MAKGNLIKTGTLAVLALATASSFAAAGNNTFRLPHDTVPSEQNVFDKGLKQLDKAINKLDASAGDPRWQQDLNDKLQSAMEKLSNVKWDQELGRALEKVNLEKMQQQLQESLAKIDMQKVKQDVAAALEKVDKAKIRAEVDKAMQKVDWDAMKRDLRKQLDEVNTDIDFDKLRIELDKAGKDALREIERAKKEGSLELKMDMEKLRSDLKRQRLDLEGRKSRLKGELSRAHEELEAAREELGRYKAMTAEMEKDGLISQNGNYLIEYKDGKLTVNGEKQRRRVNKKYNRYFRKNQVRISKENSKLQID